MGGQPRPQQGGVSQPEGPHVQGQAEVARCLRWARRALLRLQPRWWLRGAPRSCLRRPRPRLPRRLREGRNLRGCACWGRQKQKIHTYLLLPCCPVIFRQSSHLFATEIYSVSHFSSGKCIFILEYKTK